jgi:hypothetical protein
MIAILTAPPCGNCLAILVNPPGGTDEWRLLRRPDDAFTGYDDPDAQIVAEGEGDEARQFYDWEDALLNGTLVFYQVYAFDGFAWTASGSSLSMAPAYQTQSPFLIPAPVDVVRQRLELGLASELAAGNLRHPDNVIPVLRSPPLIDQTVFPSVTVILSSRQHELFGIGENLLPDAENDSDQIEEFEGRLDRSNIQIAVWSLNSDQRAQFRNAVERVLMLNFPVFEMAGMSLVDLAETELFDHETYNVPLFMAQFTLSATHPAIIRGIWPKITSTSIQHAEA